MLERDKEARLIGPFVFASLIASQVSLGAAAVLSEDPELMTLVPGEASEGAGSWRAGGYYIATGYSDSAEIFVEGKEKDIEHNFAKKDAKARIVDEQAVQFYYRFYCEASNLDPVVLENLAELCVQMHLNESATAFRKELSRLCPASSKP
jgi:hypothetical protein